MHLKKESFNQYFGPALLFVGHSPPAGRPACRQAGRALRFNLFGEKNRQKVFPLQSLMQIVLNKKIQNQSHFYWQLKRKN